MLKHTRLVVGVVGAVWLLAGAAQPAQALPILTSAYESQLEGYLGQGPLDFELIFEKTPLTSSSTAFHSAVDGQGPTFTLIQAIYNGQEYIIGGYNPQSWNSLTGGNTSATNVERTAFIFNLTTGSEVMLAQRLTEDPSGSGYGSVQTFNASDYGPTFGFGRDLYVDSSLSNGYAYQYSYGTPSGACVDGGANVFGSVRRNDPGCANNGTNIGFTISALEVYTFEQAASVPDAPTTVTLFGIGFVGLAALRWRTRRA